MPALPAVMRYNVPPTAALATLLLLVACSNGGPTGQFPTQVVVAPAKVASVRDTLRLTATIGAPDRIDVASTIAGRIERIWVDDGARVALGDRLFDIDGARLEAAAAAARARRDAAQAQLQRIEALHAEGGVSDRERDDARTAAALAAAEYAAALADLAGGRITAPFAGVVTRRLVSPGAYVRPGDRLIELVANDPLEARILVPERYTATLRPGLKVLLRPAAGEPVSGTVVYVAPIVDLSTRSIETVARVTNTDGRLKPGMFAEAEIVVATRSEAVTVPEASLVQQGDASTLFVAGPDDTADMRTVRVGTRYDGFVEIQAGVAPGERVVVDGVSKIRQGTPLSYSKATTVQP